MKTSLPFVLLASFLLLPAAFPAGDDLAAAEALLGEGRPAGARALAEKALEGESGDAAIRADWLELLGRSLRAEGRPWDAEAAFARALEAVPDHYGALLGRGEVFLDLSSAAAAEQSPRGAVVRALAADAIRWLDAAAAARPGETRPLRGAARARILDLDFDGASAVLREIIAADPGDAEGRHLLAAALRGAGDREGAAAAEAACLERDPSRSDAAAMRVGDLAATDRIPEARAAALEALLRDPASDPLYRALWEVDAPEQRWAAVEESLLRVLAKHPDDPKALHYLGYIRLSAGRIEDALQAFSRKSGLEPGNPAPMLQVARLRVARSDLAGAEESYEKALTLIPPSDEAARGTVMDGLYAIGSAHGAARRFADAERVFRRLTVLDPGSASYRSFLGLSLRRLGRYADAEAVYLEAVDLAVFDGSPRNDLGLLYLGWGRTADARAAFTASAAEDPRLSAPLENLGTMARLEGDSAGARRFFLEAHRRAAAFRDEDDRRKFRRYLDLVAAEAGAAGTGGR